MTAYSLKQASFLVLVHIVDYCGFHFIPGASRPRTQKFLGSTRIALADVDAKRCRVLARTEVNHITRADS